MGRSPRGGHAGSRLIPRIVRYSLAVSGHPLAANLFLCLMENEIAATIGESLQQLSLSRQSERGDIRGTVNGGFYYGVAQVASSSFTTKRPTRTP